MEQICLAQWLIKCLDLDNAGEVAIYINSFDNTDYMLYETTDTLFVHPINGDPSSGYHRSCYEDNSKPTTSSSKRGGRKRKSDSHTPVLHKIPNRSSLVVVSKTKPPFKVISKTQGEEDCFSRRMSFNVHFLSMMGSENVDEKMLNKIFDSLDGFELTDRVYEVASAALDFVSIKHKTLANTMNIQKRNQCKMFKRQLNYILSRVCSF